MHERAALELVGELVAAAGDDAATHDDSVFTIDMLHEATDFPAGTTRYTAGWRAVGASLSDIAAMGAEATVTVAVYGAPQFEETEITRFVEGAKAVSSRAGATYVGGDLDQHGEFTVATAALGHTEESIGRAGAEPGDVLCVTGALGRSAAAVRYFDRGKEDRGNELFRFEPRVGAGLALAPYVTAMMDSSDGLARSLHQLSEAGDVGFQVQGDAIPIHDALRGVTDGRETLSAAVEFGEDFELVCTMPEPTLGDARGALDVDLTVIGAVRPSSEGITLDGEELSDTGYTHGS
ncbi:MAG: thiamine-phosphate kinase [Halodesulfurarchaeum sp.]